MGLFHEHFSPFSARESTTIFGTKSKTDPAGNQLQCRQWSGHYLRRHTVVRLPKLPCNFQACFLLPPAACSFAQPCYDDSVYIEKVFNCNAKQRPGT